MKQGLGILTLLGLIVYISFFWDYGKPAAVQQANAEPTKNSAHQMHCEDVGDGKFTWIYRCENTEAICFIAPSNSMSCIPKENP